MSEFTFKNKGRFKLSSMVDIDGMNIFAEALSYMRFLPSSVYASKSYASFDMIGFSPMFDERENGEDIPEYSITIISDDGKFVSVDVERK